MQSSGKQNKLIIDQELMECAANQFYTEILTGQISSI